MISLTGNFHINGWYPALLFVKFQEGKEKCPNSYRTALIYKEFKCISFNTLKDVLHYTFSISIIGLLKKLLTLQVGTVLKIRIYLTFFQKKKNQNK